VDSLVLPVDIPIYQGFWGFEPVCKKYLQTISGKTKAKAIFCLRLSFLLSFLRCGE
jgi:hypothetical protein